LSAPFRATTIASELSNPVAAEAAGAIGVASAEMIETAQSEYMHRLRVFMVELLSEFVPRRFSRLFGIAVPHAQLHAPCHRNEGGARFTSH
jgi:hypothetical protein